MLIRGLPAISLLHFAGMSNLSRDDELQLMADARLEDEFVDGNEDPLPDGSIFKPTQWYCVVRA